jgi:hypothetical protein
VSSEFSTFLAVFLGTVTLLAVAAKLGLLDNLPGGVHAAGATAAGAAAQAAPGAAGAPPTGDDRAAAGAAWSAEGADSAASAANDGTSGAAAWGGVLRGAAQSHGATSTAALALLVLFFGWVLAVNPLDEAQYYMLGFCNPLLYGLPFAIHYALSPHAGAAKPRPPPPQATNPSEVSPDIAARNGLDAAASGAGDDVASETRMHAHPPAALSAEE